MDDRSVMNLKSSDRLKQEIDNEQICSSFNRLYKNAAGAKVACLDLVQHRCFHEAHDKDFKLHLEIVEIKTVVTDNVIKYN